MTKLEVLKKILRIILPFPSVLRTANWLLLSAFYVLIGAIINLFFPGALLGASIVSICVLLAGIVSIFGLERKERQIKLTLYRRYATKTKHVYSSTRDLILEIMAQSTSGVRLSRKARLRELLKSLVKPLVFVFVGVILVISFIIFVAPLVHLPAGFWDFLVSSFAFLEPSIVPGLIVFFVVILIFLLKELVGVFWTSIALVTILVIGFLFFVAPHLSKFLADFAGYLASDPSALVTFVVSMLSTVTFSITLFVFFFRLPVDVIEEIDEKKIEFGILGTVLLTISDVLVLLEGMQGISTHFSRLGCVAIAGMVLSIACIVCSWTMCGSLLVRGMARRNISHFLLAVTIGMYAAITMLYATTELLGLLLGLGIP